MEKVLETILINYSEEIIKQVKKEAIMGRGREILGGVINRPEDTEIGIDKLGEKIIEKIIKKYNLNTTIFSEPEDGTIKIGDDVSDFYISIDPFDGSLFYLRGFESNWFSALSFYDKNKIPLLTSIVDILNEKYYITKRDGNYLVSVNTGEERKIFPSTKEHIDDSVVLASYIMSSQYSKKFFNIFGDLILNLHPKALLYPNGGSYIYAYLASGLVDAYIMFDEPRSEIDPGFPIAKRIGCEIVSINENGSFENYNFLPGHQHDKVDLLIATSTSKLRDILIKHYVNKIKR